jgi:hypothetical protein
MLSIYDENSITAYCNKLSATFTNISGLYSYHMTQPYKHYSLSRTVTRGASSTPLFTSGSFFCEKENRMLFTKLVKISQVVNKIVWGACKYTIPVQATDTLLSL